MPDFHCAADSDEPVTYINRLKKSSSMDRHTPRPQKYSSYVDYAESSRKMKSSTLPTQQRSSNSPNQQLFTRPPNPDLPGFPYRAPSPINGTGEVSRQGGASPVVGGASPLGRSANSKRSIFRRRAESVDNYKIRHH